MYRTGQGIDFHKLVEGREFWLGGVKIPHSKGALGYSDADVLLHAICDALLGALSLGDMAFFEAAIATLADVPINNARVLIHDAGSPGLTSLYEKSGLPERMLPAVRAAVEVLREVQFDGGERDHERYRSRVIARILTQFEEFPVEDLDFMLDKMGDALTA